MLLKKTLILSYRRKLRAEPEAKAVFCRRWKRIAAIMRK